jgi:hypothetical protein
MVGRRGRVRTARKDKRERGSGRGRVRESKTDGRRAEQKHN